MSEVDQVKGLVKAEVPLNRYIPQETHVSRYVVKTKAGEYQAYFKVDGVSFDCLSDESIDSFHGQLVSWINASLKGGEFGIVQYRARSKISRSMGGRYNNDFSEILAAQYYDTFEGTQLLQTELYLCICFKPKIDGVTKQLMKAMSAERIAKLQNEYIARLEDVAEQTKRTLKQFGVERMGMYERDGKVYSEVKNFLGFLCNGEWVELPLERKPLYDQIGYARNSFRSEYRSIKTVRGTKYAAYADFTDYPEEYKTGALDKLLSAKFEFVEVTTFRPDGLNDGKARLDRMEGYVISAGDVTDNELDAFEKAKAEQKEGNLVFGDFHYAIGVFGDTWDEVLTNKAELFSVMAGIEGFSVAVIEQIAAAAFFSQLPGNWDWAPRLAYINDEAYTGIASMHNYPTGKAKGNPWGDAVTILKTPSMQPYFFNFHVTPEETDNEDDKAPGNTVLIGQTGSGKTVTEAFLCSHLMKVKNIRLVAFDKDRGLEPFIRRIGGTYRNLRIGEPTGLQPFKAQEATPKYLAHLNALFAQCVSAYGALSIRDKGYLDHAIRAVYELPKHLRTVTTMLQNIPEAGTDLAEKLREWAHGDDGKAPGVYAWVFDNQEDVLDLENGSAFGFDYTELLDYPGVNSPMLFHLLYRNEGMLDGRPYVYVMAEFWKALDNPIFTDFARNKQKTIRKQNGFGIFDTQEPADMIKSTIGGTMVQQSVTKIFLPNPEAIWEDYQKMGCSHREYLMVKEEMHPTSRQFLVKQGHSCVRVMLDLSSADPKDRSWVKHLDILSGSTDNVEILEEIIKSVGENPKKWVGPYFDALEFRRGKTRHTPDDLLLVDLGEQEFTVDA